MSDATDRPVDDDAWAKACAEDLEAEKARRRAQHGPPPGSAAEELRKLVDAVADKFSSLQSPLFGAAAQGTVQQIIKQAKSAVEPVIERNPDVFDHIAAAGSELLAAYRSAVEGQERRWTQGAGDPAGTGKKADDPSDPRDEGPAAGEHIDLD
ncbi:MULTISPECIES: DUF5304 domain-containing protein [unclassified Streptomyces]|uniref:DUF5304 domain-containing protein n=1 Tax=unclassified Streptomyces TaxID=2593676 RepID=UPI000F5BB17C|nr:MULTISPECIES: DUF5304 domain-containing protein [unclassified Streptomyces]WSG50332.1 DUF5304 domain-containing protein [Streptomyces sp. NBC_01732]WSX00985.1 DUF5304 domain-containing protein [Streptomyces sp. NBC_00987]MCX4397176.1 DUF5304 domain-containing protein [Streptomyces sp. NBC_01767]MCX5100121.1 DUF5304 domain-containing protein [Streptomyces sp. NBC_00439]MCX5159667.1 DUF5304 domain-containing protein [Streptomyces sp. NBC_00305]